MSFFGFSDSRNNSWATISEAIWSSTSPVTKTIRSRSRREKMSKLRSPRLVCSTTTGTRAASGSIMGISSLCFRDAAAENPAGWPLRHSTSSARGRVSRGQMTRCVPMEDRVASKKKGRENPPRLDCSIRGLVALARIGREERLELVLDTLIFVGVGGGFLFDRDVRPFGAELAVHLEPLFKPALGVGQDRLGRAFGFAHAAVDAFVRIDDEHILALIETVDGAHLDTVHIFAPDAGIGDDIGHGFSAPSHDGERAVKLSIPARLYAA